MSASTPFEEMIKRLNANMSVERRNELQLISELIEGLKLWWSNSDKSNETLTQLLSNQHVINGYTYSTSSGHRAVVIAKCITTNKLLCTIDCGAPDNPDEYYSILKRELNKPIMSWVLRKNLMSFVDNMYQLDSTCNNNNDTSNNNNNDTSNNNGISNINYLLNELILRDICKYL